MSAKISLALGGARKPPPTDGIRRPHEALREDRDHDEDSQEHGARQTVSHFDHSAGGAIDAARPKEQKAPLIIAPQANRDWREASQRNKRRKIEDVRFQGEVDEKMVDLEAKKPGFGLNVPSKAEEVEEVGGLVNGHAEAGDVERVQKNGDTSTLQEAETDDQRALAALLGNETKKSTLIVPAMTEEEAFDRDVSSAPPIPTLADYDRIPVEDFGAALLRGMGWKEGEGIGSERGKKVEKTQLPKRRPALLGIGAKEEAAVAQELGAWGRGAAGAKGGRGVGGADAGVGYQPVLLRDKKTGELFTEEELEKKKAEDERRKYELEFEEKENRKEDRRREDRRRDRDGGDRDKDRKRDRSRDRDRRKYDSDEEYHRRKKEERRRREREGKDSDRERSRRYDSERDRHRDRDRDRRR